MESRRQESKSIKSGAYCRCLHCGYEGYVYGTPIIGGEKSTVSAPWCPQCGINNKLEVIPNGKERRKERVQNS